MPNNDLAALRAAASLWPGLDHIANFINTLDTEGMTAKDVRTAIYTECLSPKHGRAGNLVQIDEGMRERVETCLRNIEKRATVQPDEIGNAKQLEINCYTILAHLADLRAAIAAMGGAK